MENTQHSDTSTEDLLFQSARWLKPSSELNRTVFQAPFPNPLTKVWETFRELPKPLSWSQDDPRGKEPPQDSAEWVRMWKAAGLDSFFRDQKGSPIERWQSVQARSILNLEELVSRPYDPVFEDGPQPLLLWRKRLGSVPGNTTYPEPAAEYYSYPAVADNDEIRMLDLLPGQGAEPLAFKLRSSHLNDPATQYEALSYAWGNQMVDVISDGNRFSFPHSLYRALLGLRDPTQIRPVWADAICINQKDDKEKSHQVRMMRRIFKQANRVLIWLDERDAHVAQVAFELAGRIHRGQLQDIPPPQSPIWGVLVRLFDKVWFSRIWVLQEVVLASSALVIWGPATAPWEHIGFSAGWLCNTIGHEVLTVWLVKVRNSRNGQTYSERSYHPGVYRANLMYSLWLASKSESSLAKPVSFYELLCQTRPFQSTDPRDKVFSLIGIPTADADPDSDQFFIEPDYSKTTEEVYIDVAKRISARSCASLSVLGAVQHEDVHRGGKLTLPTWVPDWTVFLSRSLVPVEGPEYAPLPSSRSVSMDGSTLLVSGVIVDTVTYVEWLYSRNWVAGTYTSLSKAWEEITKRSDTYPGGVDLGEAFCWTITGGNNWLGQHVTAADRAQHIADYETFRKHHCADHSFPVLAEPREITRPVEADAHRYFEALCHACSNRNFFVTEKGYMGLGPCSMKKGAEVSLLSGAELPMVLMKSRPQSAEKERLEGPEPSFSVVGECYVYGIMDGQIGSDASNWQEIRLV